jgi:hypothetical protein
VSEERKQFTLRQLREALAALDGAPDDMPVMVRVESDEGYLVGGLFDVDVEEDHNGENPMLVLDGAYDAQETP